MLKVTSVVKRGRLDKNGWWRYDGGRSILGKEGALEGGIKIEASKRDKHKRERKKGVNSVTIHTNLSSSDELREE